MKTFSIKFNAAGQQLDAIVTEYDHHQEFQVDIIGESSAPIILRRSPKTSWLITERGSLHFSDRDFKDLQNAIELQLNDIYSVKKMLVLTDFSSLSLHAAKYASELAGQLKTRNIILYHSYESVPVSPTAFAPVSAEFIELPELSLQKIADLKNELQQLIPPYTSIEARTDERNLINAVTRLAEQQGIGVVAAGVSDKNSVERALAVSKVMVLAAHCPAPLLLVPPLADFRIIKKVVFACDLKQVTRSTPVLAIKTIVQALDAQLLILNINLQHNHFHPDTIGQMIRLHELWDDHRPQYHYIDHVDIAAGIMEFSVREQAELVITVAKQYGFFQGLFHRSTSRKLARQPQLPLLLFREES